MKVIVYDTFLKRLIGLSFKRKINHIACFPNCNSIHTFFMFQNIDVVMTDKNKKILHIYKSIKPWRIILPKKNIFYTYELQENSTNNLKINQIFPY